MVNTANASPTAGNGLSDETKRQLKSSILALRRLLEEDLGRELRRLGIDPGKRGPTPAEELGYLSEAEREARRMLDVALAREREAADTYRGAVEALRREAVYTHLNRLVALKCLELRGHLTIEGQRTEAVTGRAEYGGRPKWLWTLRDREGRYRHGEGAEELLWREGLSRAYAAVGEEIRLLFDPEDPYAQVWPSHRALREAVDALNALPDEAYRADELLGWVYQYFQTEEKDRVFEEARTKKKKIGGADIIAVTQIYTERYMVDFLLQNSIGRRWMEMYGRYYEGNGDVGPGIRGATSGTGGSGLGIGGVDDGEGGDPVANRQCSIPACWPYYVTPATPHTRPPKALKEWTILDPCVGSGHFLVVAFDLLARLYAEERRLAAEGIVPEAWTAPEEETANTILGRNLHGIDIDPRAVQLATLALYLKGKELGLARPPRINVVAADATFMESESWREYVAGFKREHSVRRILEALAESLKDIRELGSLLQPEVELERIIREEHGAWEERARRGQEQLALFPELEGPRQQELPFEQITDERFWEELAPRVENAIRAFLQRARERGEIADQVVAGEAHKGFAFLELCRRRYDVVCTNPPYLGSKGMDGLTRSFVAARYPSGRSDLCTAFLLRGRELAQRSGHVAMVTQQSWLFLRSFADLRALSDGKATRAKGVFTGVLRETTLETLAHLGEHGFEDTAAAGAFVALFTFRNADPSADHRLTAFRLVAPKSGAQKAALLRVQLAKEEQSATFSVLQHSFLLIPNSPLCYWLGPRALKMLASGPYVGDFVDVRQGTQTADNQRFVRFLWEIPPGSEQRWVPFAKGGAYRKWCGNANLLVDWEDSGTRVKNHIAHRYPYLKGNWQMVVRNEAYYGRPGATFSQMCRGSLGVREMPAGWVFSAKGPAVLSKRGKESLFLPALGVLNSHFLSYVLRAACASLDFSESYIQLAPFPRALPEPLLPLVTWCIYLKRALVALEVDERTFKDVWACDEPGSSLTQRYMSATSIAEGVASWLHASEGLVESLVCVAYGLASDGISAAMDETGVPAGWNPLVAGYEDLPPIPCSRPKQSQSRLTDVLAQQWPTIPRTEDVTHMKDLTRALYTRGPGAVVADGELEAEVDEGEGADVASNCVPFPSETLLEEISRKIGIHPISVYWLLEEMRCEEGLVCPPELQRHTEDYFSVNLLRMLGHRWPMQDQYEREEGRRFLDEKWVDADGIIPLTLGTGEETLIERMRGFLDEEFGAERGPAVEVEAGQILGYKKGDEWGKQKPTTLARWLERQFFKRHVSQFKRRPIAWHLTSERGTFQAIVYYHKFDRNRLTLLRARYVREALEGLRRELGRVKNGEDRQTLARVAELEERIAEVQDFDRRLGLLLEGHEREARIWCPWKAPEEQPVGWDPDINDGVRVNVAPMQRLGLLASGVLSKKDLGSLLAPQSRD